jgi:hypothetical protein
VACVDSNVRDGYGNEVPRSSACYDTSKTVKIMITDSCEHMRVASDTAQGRTEGVTGGMCVSWKTAKEGGAV